jgi:pimeloyl-ACP methyl ester carboxylesterase
LSEHDAVVSSSAGAAGAGSRLRWRACHPEPGPGFECASLEVPLDHDRPWSIVIGFDPRGIIESDPLLCFRSLEESFSVVAPFAFPLTGEEEALVASLDGMLDQACQRRGGSIADHMATADVARDLDLLREAVGDSQLTYVGYSYGSFLGVTYANMFPERVRSVVVDGVLDPIAWTTGRGDEAATLPPRSSSSRAPTRPSRSTSWTGPPPPIGTVCEQDFGPFETVTASASAELAQRAQARAEAMSHVGLFLPGS